AELAASAGLAFNLSDPVRSQATYGLGGSVMLWPQRLAVVVEFLAQSQLDVAFRPSDTQTLTYSGGNFATVPLLGVAWDQRSDLFDFVFALRALIVPGLAVFAAGTVALNPDAAIRPEGIVPTIGIGGTF